MKYYEYILIVGFEETNLTGNVYFANHIRCQGKCREMFIRDKCSAIVKDIEEGTLALVTMKCSCEYFHELKAFNEVFIRMRLESITGHRISLTFEYLVEISDVLMVMAKGMQEIGCMARSKTGLNPIEPPKDLIEALSTYH